MSNPADFDQVDLPNDDKNVFNAKEKEKEIRLHPKIGLINGCTVIIGTIIGSGIFVAPAGVLENTGSVGLSLVIWVACGIYSMIGAYCYAELGCMIPKSGADYAYIMDSFGPFVAFLRLWVECIIVRPCSTAIVAKTFALYALRPFFPTCDPPESAKLCLAVTCLGILTFINCWKVKWSTRVQDFFTYGKLSALALIIVAGIIELSKGHIENFNFDNSVTDFSKIALSFYSGLFAYNGWNYLNFVIEELKNPHRNLPLAIIISIVTVIIVYTMTIIAFHSILTVDEVQSSPAVAVAFGIKLHPYMIYIIPIFVAMSTFGGVNGVLFTSSRLFYAGAEYNQMPQLLSMIQITHFTPTPAVIAMCLITMIYLPFQNIFDLINYVGFSAWLAIGLAVVCIPYLRWKKPDLPRPIKVNLFWPYFYIIVTIFIIIVPIYAEPIQTGMGCLIIASGAPVYFIFVYCKDKPKLIQSLIHNFTVVLQKLFVVVPPEKSR